MGVAAADAVGTGFGCTGLQDSEKGLRQLFVDFQDEHLGGISGPVIGDAENVAMLAMDEQANGNGGQDTKMVGHWLGVVVGKDGGVRNNELICSGENGECGRGSRVELAESSFLEARDCAADVNDLIIRQRLCGNRQRDGEKQQRTSCEHALHQILRDKRHSAVGQWKNQSSGR